MSIYPEEDFTTEEVDVAAIEEILGYTFRDSDLLIQALTHGSYYYPEKDGKTYEWHETYGELALNLEITGKLCEVNGLMSVEELRRLHIANVDTEKLARAAINSGLYKFLRHKAPYLKSEIEEFIRDMETYPTHFNGLANAPRVLASMFRALLGAITRDSDIGNLWEVFSRLVEPWKNNNEVLKHPVSELYKMCQERGVNIKIEDTWEHNTKIGILINDELVGSASHDNKKEIVYNRAAKYALDYLMES